MTNSTRTSPTVSQSMTLSQYLDAIAESDPSTDFPWAWWPADQQQLQEEERRAEMATMEVSL
jgi:hypothetical protein